MADSGVDKVLRSLEQADEKIKSIQGNTAKVNDGLDNMTKNFSKSAEAIALLNKELREYGKLSGKTKPIDLNGSGSNNKSNNSKSNSDKKDSDKKSGSKLKALGNIFGEINKATNSSGLSNFVNLFKELGSGNTLGFAANSLGLLVKEIKTFGELADKAQSNLSGAAKSLKLLGESLTSEQVTQYEKTQREKNIDRMEAQVSEALGRAWDKLIGNTLDNIGNDVKEWFLGDVMGATGAELDSTVAQGRQSIVYDAIAEGTSFESAGMLADDIYSIANRYSDSLLAESPTALAQQIMSAVMGDESALKQYGLLVNEDILDGFMQLEEGLDAVNVEYSESALQLHRLSLITKELTERQTKGAKAAGDLMAVYQRTGEAMNHFKNQLFSFDEVISLDAYNPEHYGELPEYKDGHWVDEPGTGSSSGTPSGSGSIYNPYEQIFDKTGTYAAISNPVNLVRAMMQSGAIDASGGTYEIPEQFKSYVAQQLTQWYKENPTGEHHIAGTMYHGTDYATLAEALVAVGLADYAGPISQEVQSSRQNAVSPLTTNPITGRSMGNGIGGLTKVSSSPFDVPASQSYNKDYIYSPYQDVNIPYVGPGTTQLQKVNPLGNDEGPGLEAFWGLEDGGIGTQEMRANLFEGNKKEAVIPLESAEGINYLSEAMREAGAGSNGIGGDSITVNLTLSGLNIANNQSDWQWVAQRIAEEIDVQRQRRGELNYGASY